MITFFSWNEQKTEVLNRIEKAGITDKTAIKLILFVERKINSATNCVYDRNRSIQFAVNKYGCPKFEDAMSDLGNQYYCGYYYKNEPYHAEWMKYCEVAGYSKTGFGLGDALC